MLNFPLFSWILSLNLLIITHNIFFFANITFFGVFMLINKKKNELKGEKYIFFLFTFLLNFDSQVHMNSLQPF